MKRFLSITQMNQLVQAVILSSLDYCNSLYFGCSNTVLNQLQIIQNRACSIILGLKKSDSKAANLKKLHWLRIRERIQFKILIVTYKALNGQAPIYISELVRYSNLSGSRNPSLQTYMSKSCMGDRAFISCAATLWNKLPPDVKCSSSLASFKTRLKTHLFEKSYGLIAE